MVLQEAVADLLELAGANNEGRQVLQVLYMVRG